LRCIRVSGEGNGRRQTSSRVNRKNAESWLSSSSKTADIELLPESHNALDFITLRPICETLKRCCPLRINRCVNFKPGIHHGPHGSSSGELTCEGFGFVGMLMMDCPQSDRGCLRHSEQRFMTVRMLPTLEISIPNAIDMDGNTFFNALPGMVRCGGRYNARCCSF
jgi:hypothetical protein